MSNNPLFDLADDCQKAADEIDARLLDFAHPLNTALRNELNDQSAKLSIAASSLRLQAIEALVPAGTAARTQLDKAAGDAHQALTRITRIEHAIALTAALLQLAGAIAIAVGTGNPAGIGPAANGLITAAKPFLHP